MNKHILVLLAMITLLSCGGDDDKKYKFKDQNLSGKIGGSAWTFADGYSDIDGGMADITLTLEQDGEGCDMGMPEGNRVFFYVPAAPGLYPLQWDMGSSSDIQTVTLLEVDGYINHIATEGAIEILTITETAITGRIDAHLDGDNTINGNFAVDICLK